MAKQITLPLGMQVGDVDVGTLSLDSGRTYNVTNITTQAIEDAMGVSGDNGIKELSTKSTATKPGLRKWAAFKPTGNAKPHGMIVNVVTHEIEYDAPTDADGYRLGDFAGYNNLAPIPYVHPLYDIYFSSTGNKLGMILIKLPEFDLRDISTSITHLAAKVYVGAGYTTLENTYTEEITDDIVSMGNVAIDFYVACTAPNDKAFKVVVELGYINATRSFVKYCEYPTGAGGVTSRLATAYYEPDPTLTFPLQIDHSYINNSEISEMDVFIIEYQNEAITYPSAVRATFDFRFYKLSYEGEDDLYMKGTCDVYMQNPDTEVWHLVKSSVSMAAVEGDWKTFLEDLDTGDFPSSEIVDNMPVEFRNVTFTNY